MEFPEDLRYTDAHEWVRRDGDTVVVGITDFAQDQLGDIVYVQLPGVGASAISGATVGEVESTKSVSEIYSPASGTIISVNDELVGTPELVNEDPFARGWMFTLALSDPGELDGLLDAAAYRALVEH